MGPRRGASWPAWVLDASGALGWAPAGDIGGLGVGEARELFSCGITGPEGRSRFPIVRLSARGPKGKGGLAVAVVEQRLAPRRVRVRLADGSVRKGWCVIGGLVRGTEVLLQTRPSCRVVGCLSEVGPLLDGTEAVDLDTPRLVRSCLRTDEPRNSTEGDPKAAFWKSAGPYVHAPCLQGIPPVPRCGRSGGNPPAPRRLMGSTRNVPGQRRLVSALMGIWRLWSMWRSAVAGRPRVVR